MMTERFKELIVSGSEFEMGRQIGEECKEQIKDLVQITLQRFNLSSKKIISLNQAIDLVNKIIDSIFKDKLLKPGSYRGRKNTSPENVKTINGTEHA